MRIHPSMRPVPRTRARSPSTLSTLIPNPHLGADSDFSRGLASTASDAAAPTSKFPAVTSNTPRAEHAAPRAMEVTRLTPTYTIKASPEDTVPLNPQPSKPGAFVHARTVYDASLARCRVEIEDNGAGIPAELQVQIFMPFFTTKGSHGTGLGLAVSRKVAIDHGGLLKVSSDVGRGTTFCLELPVPPAEDSSEPGEGRVIRRPSCRLGFLVLTLRNGACALRPRRR